MSLISPLRRYVLVAFLAVVGTSLFFVVATCGGKTTTTTVKLLDGGTATLRAGALCDGWDAAGYFAAPLSPPSCDPHLVAEAGLPPIDNPVCNAWAHTLGLPLLPGTACGFVGDDNRSEAGVCGIRETLGPNVAAGLANDETKAYCSFGTSDGDRYCSAVFSQLVVGGGQAFSSCAGYPDFVGISAWPKEIGLCTSTLKTNCVECYPFNTTTNPPTPQVCVERDGVAKCEPWCQPH
jgi:hypothetical protein